MFFLLPSSFLVELEVFFEIVYFYPLELNIKLMKENGNDSIGSYPESYRSPYQHQAVPHDPPVMIKRS